MIARHLSLALTTAALSCAALASAHTYLTLAPTPAPMPAQVSISDVSCIKQTDGITGCLVYLDDRDGPAHFFEVNAQTGASLPNTEVQP
jgi:hypothetical protein